MWDQLLRVLDQVGQNIIQDKEEFTDLGSFSEDKGNNTLVRTPRGGAKLLLLWLIKPK